MLCIGVFPHLLNAASPMIWPSETSAPPFAYDIAYVTASGTFIVCAVLFIMWRSADDWRFFGVTRIRPVVDALLGVALWAVALIVQTGAWLIIWPFYILNSSDFTQDSFQIPQTIGAGFWIGVVGLSLVNGFAEELVMRGYVLPRLARLTSSNVIAIVASTALFSAYHMYQGIAGVISTFALGLVMAMAFILLRRIWPLALAHALLDVLAYAQFAG